MIQYIEGLMCSGKTTLVNKLLTAEKKIAPEPTPPPLSDNVTLEERQQSIFESYISSFEKLIYDSQVYLCDYSPWGIIPFEMGLSEWSLINGNLEESFILSRLAEKHHKMLIIKQVEWKDRCVMVKFLSARTATIIKRLVSRNREGDNLWPMPMVALLNKYYNNYFKFLEDNKILNIL
jgi:hypothetical protein